MKNGQVYESGKTKNNLFNFNLGRTYHLAGNAEKAITFYKKAIEIYPYYADAYNNLGLLYSDIGRRREAAALFRKAMEIDPDHKFARDNLADISVEVK